MVSTSFYRGWPIYWDKKDKIWRYVDNNKKHSVKNPRPCKRCGSNHSNNEPDPCLGLMPGFVSACCGHGEKTGYATYSSVSKNIKIWR